MKEQKKINLNAYEVREIALFSGKSQKEIISFYVGSYNDIKYKTLSLYGEEYETTGATMEYISLKNKIVNARAINLKRKENFIVKMQEYNYLTNNKKLYINIDEEGIQIQELTETIEEIQRGEKRIYKNYKIDNLKIDLSVLKLFAINEDELEQMSYKEYQRYRVTDIKKDIEDHQKLANENTKRNFDKLIKNLKTLLKNGSVATGQKYEVEEKNTFKISIYDRLEESEERIQYKKNYKYLEEHYKISAYSETYGVGELLKKLGIDLYKVDIETILKGSKNA